MSWTYVINGLDGEDGTFYENKLQKTNQEKLKIEKAIIKKEINYTSNGKVVIIHLIVGLIKKTL